MQQLTSQDASFIYSESPHAPMHVGYVMILDPSTSPDGDLTEDRLLQFYGERLHMIPFARRRLVRVPFDLDYPYWIEDERFDLEYHVREIGLPEPADWRQFFTLCARILSRPLDLSKSPWETYLIHGLDRLEGVPAGCVGLLQKIHHCAVDGRSVTEMTMALSDIDPEGTVVTSPTTRWRGAPVPNDVELMLRTHMNNLTRPFRMLEVLAQSAQAGPASFGLAPSPSVAAGSANASAASQPLPVPKTRFNEPVSAHRVIGAKRFELDVVRAMKNEVPEATVNDVVLAISGGMLRKYLYAQRELPKDSLIAMAPVNLRRDAVGYELGNQVGAMFVAIGTEIADPLERLRAIQEFTRNAKALSSAVGAERMTRWGDFVPAATAAAAARLTSQFAAANRTNNAFNCTITNVPGPQVPLYTLGCRVVTQVGFAPISDNMGLSIPVQSYAGELTINFTACRDMIPDPDFFMQCIQESFDEMRAATLGADAEAKIAAAARDYAHMEAEALAEVRTARARAQSRGRVEA